MSSYSPTARSSIAASGIACAVLAMSSSALQAQQAVPGAAAVILQPVVVTATRFPEDPATLPFGVSVLTAETIRESGVSTVNEAIMKLLGVPGRLDLYGGGDYGLDLRGFGQTADNNQAVIVDGIKINEADLGGTRLAGIPIDAVETIEVIRGNASVLYGEGATGGAIVITTKAGAGVARQNHADVYLGGGSFNLREARAGATLVNGGFSIDLAGNKRDSDNDRANFKSKVDGFSLAGQWRSDWLRIGARYAEDYLDTGMPGALTAAEYAADPTQTTHPDDHASIRNGSSGAFAEATLGDWKLAFDIGHRDKGLDSISSGFVYAYDIVAKTYAARARNSTSFGKFANAFVVGYDRGDWERQVRGAFGGHAEQSSHAVYLKDDLTLPTGTKLSAGWRTEQIEKSNTDSTVSEDQDQHAWDVGIVQPLGGGFSAYGRYGHSFRLANVDEFGFTTPNVILQPQTSKDAELGARWTHADGRAELRVYRSALTNEIGYDPSVPGPFGFGANTNFDPTRREGIELEVTQALNAAIDLRLNAATRRARFTSGAHDGKDVPLTPHHTASLGADWTPLPAHRLGAVLNWVSSQSPDFDNACKMPGYVTADLRYAYRYSFAEFALGVQNVGDRKYYTQAFSCINGQTSSIYPEAGRAFVASVRMSF